MSLYHEPRFDPKEGHKTYRLKVAERMLGEVRNSDPAPGAGLWDDTPVALVNPWVIPTREPIGLTLGGAMDFMGSKKEAAATFPFSRLALHLNLRGYPWDTECLWSRGGGSQRSTVSCIIGDTEYRDVDGLVFETTRGSDRHE